METSATKATRKIRRRGVSAVAMSNTYDLASKWVDILRGWQPRAIAKRLGVSPRTVENWQDGINGPTWKHTVAMLNDDELCSRLLQAAGRHDLAKQAELLSLNRRINALKAAEAAHGEQTNEYRRGLEMGSSGRVMAGRAPEQRGETLAADNGVVSRAQK